MAVLSKSPTLFSRFQFLKSGYANVFGIRRIYQIVGLCIALAVIASPLPARANLEFKAADGVVLFFTPEFCDVLKELGYSKEQIETMQKAAGELGYSKEQIETMPKAPGEHHRTLVNYFKLAPIGGLVGVAASSLADPNYSAEAEARLRLNWSNQAPILGQSNRNILDALVKLESECRLMSPCKGHLQLSGVQTNLWVKARLREPPSIRRSKPPPPPL